MSRFPRRVARLALKAQELAKSQDVLLMRYSDSNYLGPYLRRVIEGLAIDTVLDVGANTGQTVVELRELGFSGSIISFEPTQLLFAGLVERFASDPAWTGHRIALGDHVGEMTLHRYEMEDMNSFLAPTEFGSQRFRSLAAPLIADETVPITRLDEVWADFVPPGRTLLKIDTQGYDLEVIKGAAQSMESVDAVLTEVPVNHIYDGMPNVVEVFSKMEKLGFQLSGIFPISRDLAGLRMIEGNCMFVRTDAFDSEGADYVGRN